MPLRFCSQKTTSGVRFALWRPAQQMRYGEEWASRLNSRPKVSACVAAFQGERFITQQLHSILAQLAADDEIIVVDDASTDGTSSKLAALQDPRLHVIRNAKNQGILRSFETALSRSSGEIVFLSDQDDLWLPNKVQVVLDVFARDPDLMLVASDATLIDEDGTKIGDSFYARRGRFRAGLWSNILIGKFHGCTMAFRSTLLQSALPFPPATEVHHDTWIGCINALIGGKTEYIAEPLVAYRRHSSNVTGRIRLSAQTRFRVRYHLVLGLLLFCLKRARSAPRFRWRGSWS
jgi:glycosyltransferase involved in cell wall biosynthesis